MPSLDLRGGGRVSVDGCAAMEHVDRQVVPAPLTGRERNELAGLREFGPRAEAVRHWLDSQCVDALTRALPLLQPRELGLRPGHPNAGGEARVQEGRRDRSGGIRPDAMDEDLLRR